MSDFDKEAERERLREKYERDKQKREATERMSDLLLKGATMTNAHCENCGDPIFRYDGQEFCPTCEQVVADADTADANGSGATEEATTENERAQTAGTSDDGAATEGAADRDGGSAEEDANESDADRQSTPGHIEIKSPSGTPGTTDAGSADAGDADAGSADARSQDPESVDAGSADAGRASSGGPDADPTGTGTPQHSGASTGAAGVPSAGGTDGDLASARESLVRTLVAQSRQAEACDDPRRARDHLAAAREAAEALSALSY